MTPCSDILTQTGHSLLLPAFCLFLVRMYDATNARKTGRKTGPGNDTIYVYQVLYSTPLVNVDSILSDEAACIHGEATVAYSTPLVYVNNNTDLSGEAG